MLILDSENTRPVFVQLPNTFPSLGVRFGRWCFFFKDMVYFEDVEAKKRCQQWLDEHEGSDETCILFQAHGKYRLGYYVPGLQRVTSQEALTQICQWMQSSGYLDVSKHRWKSRQYDNSFLGSDAVSWFAKYLLISRKVALSIGQRCIDLNLIQPVQEGLLFQDSEALYRFNKPSP
ncbi:MAG: hypothetical protein AAGG51_21920 [Cyanobacteria bacterium P01_G01_bin.54]